MLMRIIVTGGGTGGHIYPALAIARGLKEKIHNIDILYVGTTAGLEADIVPKSGLPFETITVEGFARALSHKTAISAFRAIKGLGEAFALIRRFKPHVVVGTGGYVCGPVVLAAALLGIPTVIHEQNAIPGVTNRLLARFVNAICVTFEDSVKYFSNKNKIHLTGLPVRPEIVSAERALGLKELGLSSNKVTIVVVGGSRGARSINRTMVQVIDEFYGNGDVQILHVAGQKDFEETLSLVKQKGIRVDEPGNIKLVPYLYQMHHALAAADVVIARAGASFLSEILLRGIPSILIPYPHAAANHQEYNARSLERHGAAKVILDSELTGPELFRTLQGMIKDDSLLKEMAMAAKKMGKINALDDITEIIISINKKR